jgi:hypothetical protein
VAGHAEYAARYALKAVQNVDEEREWQARRLPPGLNAAVHRTR